MPKYDWLLTAPANRLLSTYREGSDVELTYGDVLQAFVLELVYLKYISCNHNLKKASEKKIAIFFLGLS